MVVEYSFSDMVTKGLLHRIDIYCVVFIAITAALMFVGLAVRNYDDEDKARIYSVCLLGCIITMMLFAIIISVTRCDIYTNYEIVHLDRETMQEFNDDKIDGYICDYIGDDLYIVSLPNELNKDEEDNK